MSTPATPEDLERAFRRVQAERMRDVPILNSALEVAAIGFREWNGHQLGVLLTPWFMNLILLPSEQDDWPGIGVGEGRAYSFPSGDYDFLLGEQPGVGRYLCCSLFSPVLEFAEQSVAVATAEEVLRLLFESGTAPAEETSNAEPDEPQAEGDCPEPETVPADEAVVSRRAFIRGAFLDERQ